MFQPIHRFFVLAFVLGSLPASAQYWGPKNKEWIILSPQVGGSWGHVSGPVLGTSLSYYPTQQGFGGFGFGAYAYDGKFQGEVLAKASLYSIAGASAGASWHDGHIGFVSDIWANALFVGLRFKSTHTRRGFSQALLVFVPLWYLNDT